MSHTQLLEERLRFLDIGSDTIDDIQTAGNIMEPVIDSMLDRFYEHILAQPELRELFTDSEAISRARAGQKNHWLNSLFRGSFDNRFFEQTKHIGHAHACAGVTPNWYIGGYCYMLGQFNEHIAREFAADSTLATRLQQSVTKAIFLDMDLVIHCYLEIKDSAIRKILHRAIDFRAEVAKIGNELTTITTLLQDAAKAAAAEQNDRTEASNYLNSLIEQSSENAEKLNRRLSELQFGDRLYITDDPAEYGLLARIRALMQN